jgi:ribulose-5-phosphate 4-epimerase/fuculose-1-phosphate aldolase
VEDNRVNTFTSLSEFQVRDHVSEAEWQQRVDLAACYRLVAHYGWDDLIFTHISARVPGPEAHFLINPYGLMFDEITASSLVKVDLDGTLVMDTPYQINPAGYTIHSAIHGAREDAHCVIHLHTIAGVAVACQPEGLLPVSQHAMLPLTALAYHDYEGIALNPAEKDRLRQDLGDKQFMILRNHGLLTVARSIADAFLYMFFLQRSCEIQLAAQSGGAPLVRIPQSILNGFQAQTQQVLHNSGGQLAWPGLLRKLDRLDPTYRN